jgi:tRNA(Arg) A34 adenosine deaminase TadA
MSVEENPTPEDLTWLRRTFRLAEATKAAGKHPFASIVVDADGRIVAEAGNNSLPPDGDPTQHAEVVAASRAARLRSPAELSACTIYTSAEPCCMCAGAIYWCNIGRVVYALSEERLLGLTGNHPENPTLSLTCRSVFASGQHPVAVLGPLLEEEASQVHQGFWR